jgi:hypothetical protein
LKTNAQGNLANLGLRLVNGAMAYAAKNVLGYDDVRLNQQGTTATHIVFSSVSRFDSFVQSFVKFTLEPALHEQVLGKLDS